MLRNGRPPKKELIQLSRMWRNRFIESGVEALFDEPKPFVWTKSADQILQSIARFAGNQLAAQGKNFERIH